LASLKITYKDPPALRPRINSCSGCTPDISSSSKSKAKKKTSEVSPSIEDASFAKGNHHEAIAVVLDLMNPLGTGRRTGSSQRAARFNKSGRPGGATLG